MVLLAAAICTKAGKPLVSRQFVDMTRSHVEGLLSSFAKLVQKEADSPSQHTFVDTENVRFMYQPMEKLFIVLLTTRSSNILEDLETLRLFSRLIPEYCSVIEEREISDNAFNLIFAFDEIVALGYRENVNLNQIRTYTEMDSQDEKIFWAVRENKEREAKEMMKRRAKELEQQKREQQRAGRSGVGGGIGASMSSFSSMGMGGGSSSSSASSMSSSSMASSSSSFSASATTSSSRSAPAPARGMVLGSKKTNDIAAAMGADPAGAFSAKRPAAIPAKPTASRSGVHIKIEERISMTADHDSGMESLEVKGIVLLNINNADDAHCRLSVRNDNSRSIQFQTHPNVDKKLFGSDSLVALKQAGKAFPTNTDVPVLKWRFASTDESHLPLSINCWPSDAGDGKCDVNIEYELLQESLELRDVLISIPCPTGVGAPTVGSCDGEYKFDKRGVMEWRLTVIDSSSKQGSMEFTMPARENDFFPVTVTFAAETTFCDLGIASVAAADDRSIPFSSESSLAVDKYIIN